MYPIDLELLYSSMPPMINPDGSDREHLTFAECFVREAKQSYGISIAVGYVSKLALEELDRIVEEYGIKSICLIIGMYYVEGMPEGTYRTALHLNEKWRSAGIGEIRLIKPFKYHGKIYCFLDYDEALHAPLVRSAMLGSANLGALVTDASNRRQYEVSMFVPTVHEKISLAFHVDRLRSETVSANIADINDLRLIREQNVSLAGIDTVVPVPRTDVTLYARSITGPSFALPLKVPAYAERFIDDGNHFTKSNINVCYAAPRSDRKARDWYEIQMTVSITITRLPGYPERNVPFYVVTDDGYRFLAHTTSDHNKQFNAVGDELLIGRWLKGRLAAAGLVTPVNDTSKDTNREGMITKEMLAEYGCNVIMLRKTSKTIMDDDGTEYPVWMLSMEYKEDI